MRLLVRPTPPPLWQGFIAAAALIGVETAVVVVLKHFAPTMAFGTVYLLGVLLVGMAWGFGLAAITALVSAVAFDYCRSWPDGFGVTQLQNWVVIAVFFVVALLANSLAGLARASAIEADRRRHEADLAARQQTALRRVATLVARNVPPSEVFSAVVAELASCLDVQNAALFRYEPDGTALLACSGRRTRIAEDACGRALFARWRECCGDGAGEPAARHEWIATTTLPGRRRRASVRWVCARLSEPRSWPAAKSGERPSPVPLDPTPFHPARSNASATSPTSSQLRLQMPMRVRN